MTSAYMIAPGSTTEDLAIKRKIALALMQQGSDTSPVQHWTQGAARMLQGGLGGYEMYRAKEEDREETSKGNALLAALFQPSGSAAPAAAPVPASNSGDAIASIESGGKYDALGPIIKTGAMAGDRAYGKYQVMGSNIGPWAKEAIGQDVTPQQFLADPKLQDAVFQHRFGQYEKKYGPEGASRAWFAGEGGMNDLGRKDQLGTTVGAYGQKFAQALGSTSPAQAAPQAAPGVPNREMLIKMLGNRKTAPIAQQIISQQIQQQFKPIEYDFKERPDGSIAAINKKNPNDIRIVNPGSSQDLVDFEAKKAGAKATAEENAKRAIAAPEKAKQERATASIVTTDIDRALKQMDEAVLPTTGLVGQALSNVGGTAARNVRALVDTVKSNVGFDKLSQMRSASPTGAALGSVTEKELALLQATIGNLEQSQDDKQLRDNLRRVKNVYLDIVHGPGSGPERESLSFDNKSDDGWRDMGGGVRIREKR